MRFQRIIEAVNFKPWFISVAGHASVRALLEKATSGALPLRAEGDEDNWLSDFVRFRPPMSIDGNGIATISVFGVVGQHLTGIEKTCGNTDFGDIQREIGEAVGQGARGIIFNFDSPGGMVTGCHECAEAIAQAGVPTVAFTDSLVCSAAYYLAAGCTKIVSTTSADIGNIGVIFPWIDMDKMWEVIGVKFNPVFNTGADLKSTGSGPHLEPAQRAFLQSDIDEKAGRFHQHVLDHRVVDDEVWRAGWYSGQRAVDLGLVDFIGDASTAYGVLLSEIPVD